MERAVARGLLRRKSNEVYEHVCMDEKAIRRGHEYVSILYDAKDGTVIEVAEDRKDTSVEELCTKALTEEQRKHVKTVCTDMWSPFIKGAKTYFPNALHCRHRLELDHLEYPATLARAFLKEERSSALIRKMQPNGYN